MGNKKLFLLTVALGCILSFPACGADAKFVEGSDREAVISLETEEIDVTDAAEKNEEILSISQNEVTSSCYVHITGAVVTPGVYELSAGSRLYEAVNMAGGFTAEACQEYYNLAKVIEDGQQYQIPTMEEVESGMESNIESSEEGAGVSLYTEDGRLDINLAGKEELMQLPGIGETRAEAILSYRQQQGELGSTEELMNISGIKQGLYEQIAPYIVVRSFRER